MSLGEPLRNLDDIVAPDRPLPEGLDFFRPAGYRDALPRFARSALYTDRGWLAVIWMAIVGGVALVFALAGYGRREWLVPGVLLATTIPMAIFIWNADALGRDRHSLLVGVLGRLAMWLLVLYVVDAYLAARTVRNGGRSGRTA